MTVTLGQIPEKLREKLKTYGINPDEIVVSTVFDRDMDMYPCEGYLFFTADTLYCIETGSNSLKKINKYDLGKISSPDIFPRATGGVFVFDYHGEPVTAAIFSNSCQKQMHKFKALFSKALEGKPLDSSDVNTSESNDVCTICNKPYPDPQRKVCPRCMDKRSLFLRVLSYFKPYRLQFGLIIFCIFLHSAAGVLIPYLSGTVLYDRIISPGHENGSLFSDAGISQVTALLLLVVTIFSVRIIQQFFGVIQGRTVAGFVPRAILAIKTDVYNSMQKLSLGFFNKRQTGSLLTRIQNDAAEVLSFFIDGLPYFIINLIIIVAAFGVMLSLNVILALFTVIFIPLLFFLSYSMIPRLWHLHGKRHRSVRNMNAAIQDNITGARVVKAFGQENRETERFGGISDRVRDAELGEVYYDNKFFGIYAGLEALSLVVIWGLGSWLVINRPDTMTYGILITFVGYAAMLSGPLDFMSYMFRWWAQSLNSAQRIFEVIDAQPEVREKANPVRKDKFSGEIELKNVSFSYEPSKPVLKNVSFKIHAGEYFGIVGKTGAGKTTIINLISRFYDPTEGEILIDKIPIKDMAFEDLRKNIAVVSQDTYIFKGTISQNIAYARPGCKTGDIILASMAASCHDFITKLPHGYDTVVGTGGKDLSGGEKQRISIARAILSDPNILILDEATASVDTKTEQRIQKSIDFLTKGRTTISIAHRLSTLKNADRMIVIKDSGVSEEGTHDELISRKGSFYELMQLQTKALAIRGTDE